ncbi:MAG TPA: DUF4266 domain-containing protein [Casimicrobiaceae bacterium]|nr:DUF4266 domain-containing protein [Casimicrobiaceae bacterium]
MIASRRVLLAALAAVVAACGGCAVVQPWERGTLAKPSMATVQPPHETAQKLRTYNAKEGGAAATGVGGGGCGCN